jgi:hypothetical protein
MIDTIHEYLQTSQFPYARSITTLTICEEHATPRSTTCRIGLTYGEGTDTNAPNTLFVKLIPHANPGSQEKRFYQTIYQASIPTPYLPTCYLYQEISSSKDTIIVLADLTPTAISLSETPEPVSQFVLEPILEQLAHFHRDMSSLFPVADTLMPPFLSSRAAYDDLVKYIRHDTTVLLTHPPEPLSQEIRACYERGLQILTTLYFPFIQRQFSQGLGPSFIHGDLHPGNIFYQPAHPSATTSFVDFEAYRSGCMTDDLAMLLALHLYAAKSQVEPLLRHYWNHAPQREHLQYQDFLDMYRYSIVFALFFPAKLYAQHQIYDKEMILKATMAFRTFECNTLST